MDSPLEVAEDLDYDIYASATALLSNMTNRGNSNSDSYLSLDDYSFLTPEEKDLWSKLTHMMKSIILKVRNRNNRPNDRFSSNKSNNYSYKKNKPPSHNGNAFTKANLDEFLNELIVVGKESEDNDVVTEDVIYNIDSTLLVNSTTANKINLGDIIS